MHLLITGTGQLARMMALAARPLGVDCSFVAEDGEDTAAVTDLGSVIRWRPGQGIAGQLSVLPTAITTEKEKVPTALIAELSGLAPFRPTPAALRICQDRSLEKRFLVEQGIGTAPYVDVQLAEALDAAVTALRFPIVLKACHSGYDGKHQWRVRQHEDLEAIRNSLIYPLIAEEFVEFERELSVNVVRDIHGAVKVYPIMENLHREGVLVTTVAPAPGLAPERAEAAAAIGCRIAEALDYVGSLTAELFDSPGGLLVNELAPRPHNSGHWTMRGAGVCQFANHVRAVLGLPTATPRLIEPVAMVNVLGRIPPLESLLGDDVEVHLYQKAPRPGRKLGHLLIGGDPATLSERAASLLLRIEAI